MKVLTTHAVQQIARSGRVAKHPDYHAGNHGLGFADLVAVLSRCERVAPDPRHPGKPAYWAWGADWRGDYRIDFDLYELPHGRTILVVTAMRIP